MASAKPIEGIPPNPLGAHDWHVQIFNHRLERWITLGGSEGKRSYARGFMIGYSSANKGDRELRLVDREGFTYESI